MTIINGKSIKNAFEELTLLEWESISVIMNDNATEIEKYLDILNLLGATDEDVSTITMDELLVYIKELNDSQIKSQPTLPDSVTFEGTKYVAYEGEFKIRAKDLARIEKHAREGNRFFVRAVSIIFKQEGLSMTDHYDEVHLQKKDMLFRDQPVTSYIGYLMYISKYIFEKFKANEPTDK